jgi:hypothetical protein
MMLLIEQRLSAANVMKTARSDCPDMFAASSPAASETRAA